MHPEGKLCEMLLGCLLFLATTFGANAIRESARCEKVATIATWKDQNTLVETNTKTLAGIWVSDGCETRPGPEYVLRSYSFTHDGNYNLIQHHYWDDSCSSPKLTIISHGRLLLRNSLEQPGASNGTPKPINITLIPQDDNAAIELNKIVSTECPEQNWKLWKRNEEHLIYSNKQEPKSVFADLWIRPYQTINNREPLSNPKGSLQSYGDISCLASLKWAFNELKLIKIQFRPIIHRRKVYMDSEMELLLGDIHSKKKNREFYSPTSFQVPLYRQTNGENFTVRQNIVTIKGPNTLPAKLLPNSKSPPHLIAKPHLPPYIWGEWASFRCESRPLGVYLLRRFIFYEDEFTWIGEHKFFSDPLCTYPKFIVTASGHLNLDGVNEQMQGVTNLDFQIEKATLTALDERVITDMRLPGFCGVGEWKVNVPKELSPTNGCLYLGIYIPSIQFDIVKIEVDYKGFWLLFLGQAETNNLPTTMNERPTAFQLPLVKCGEEISFSQNWKELLERKFYYSNASSIRLNQLLLLPFFFLLKR